MSLRSRLRHFGLLASDAALDGLLTLDAFLHRCVPRPRDGVDLHLLVEGDPKQGLSPAARYRACQYVPLLEELGIRCHVRPSRPGKYFSAGASFQRFYRRSPRLATCYAIAQHYRQRFNRLRDFRKSRGPGVVFLQRDLLALSHSRFERYLPLFQRRVVFDFDDAIYASPPWSNHPDQAAIDAEMRQKIEEICALSSAVIVANQHLAEFARQHNDRVIVVPTTLCTEEFRPGTAAAKDDVPVIGWIGTSGNLHYLREIAPALCELARTHRYRLRVVCNRVPDDQLAGLPGDVLEFVEWRAEGEVERIQAFDVGIMPLSDGAWTSGKAGFKLIQYMACGVPIVWSPVGANPEVAGEPGEAGFPAASNEEWVAVLRRLLDDAALRGRLGDDGRARAVRLFDRRAHVGRIADLVSEVARDG